MGTLGPATVAVVLAVTGCGGDDATAHEPVASDDVVADTAADRIVSTLVEAGLCVDRCELDSVAVHEEVVEAMQGCYTPSPRERVQVLQYRSNDEMRSWWRRQISSVLGGDELFDGVRVIVVGDRTMVTIGQQTPLADFALEWIELAHREIGGEIHELVDL